MKALALNPKVRKNELHYRDVHPAFSAKWQNLKKSLFGTGVISRQLDGLRVQLPAVLRQRMGNLQVQPWIISVWSKGQLRVVPATLWPEYLDHVSGELAKSEKQRQEIIVQSATKIIADETQRWCIPVELAESGNIGQENSRIILVAHEAWIEIWNARQWHDRLNETLSATSQSLPDSPISLPIKPKLYR